MSLLFFIAVIVLVIFMAAVYLTVQKSRRAARMELAGKKCPKCGNSFGELTAVEAEKTYLKEASELWKNNKGIKYKLTSIWPVSCKLCNWKGSYEPAKNELLAEDVVLSD